MGRTGPSRFDPGLRHHQGQCLVVASQPEEVNATLSGQPLKTYLVLLWGLAALFFLRVLGQVLVAFFDVTILPPMQEWYSGLLPYPILLPVQVLILGLQVKVNWDFSRGAGWAVMPRPSLGRFLVWFSYVYAGSMVLRYVITMGLYPERRWFGGTIPIVFHVTLAAYLFVLGHYHNRAQRTG